MAHCAEKKARMVPKRDSNPTERGRRREARRLRFHDCRHHFASWFVMRGGSLQALKKLLGHADLKMTLRYAHLAPEHLRGEMAKTERPPGRSRGHLPLALGRAFPPRSTA